MQKERERFMNSEICRKDEDVFAKTIGNLAELRSYCRQNRWPRLSQWHHWIYSKHPIAAACVKKIGGRYLIDLGALTSYIQSASLEER
jgi:hypothetical protein